MIAINAINSNSGGGRAIRDMLLTELAAVPHAERIVVIAAESADLPDRASDAAWSIHRVPDWCARGSNAPYVYQSTLHRVLTEVDADLVLNLGDLVIKTTVPQVYLFDWAYALDVHPRVWSCMTWPDWLSRRLKLGLIQRRIGKVDVVIAQTEAIATQLRDRYGLPRLEVLGNAIAPVAANGAEADFEPLLPAGIRLLVPSLYYPHKNLEVLLDVAERVRAAQRPYRFVVTIDPAMSAAAAGFLGAIAARGLQEIVVNVGQVPHAKIGKLYTACHGVILPTLLESFTFVYIEAMHYGRPILTSDMWFAHGVCGPAATYFDPFDAASIFATMEAVFTDAARHDELTRLGRERLAGFPTGRQNCEKLLAIARRVMDEAAAR